MNERSIKILLFYFFQALHLAFEFDVRKELIKPLLHAGADVRIKDKSGVSVLDIAETKSQDVFALVQEAEGKK